MKKIFVFFSAFFLLLSMGYAHQPLLTNSEEANLVQTEIQDAVETTFTITVTYSTGGEVTPAGIAYVELGDHSEIYVFDAAEGYHVRYAIVDEVNNAFAVLHGVHRFMDVAENHTLHVVFAKNEYHIVATASEGGDINPNGVVTVPFGNDKLIFFAPKAGYDLVRVLIDNINDPDAVEAGTYLFPEVDDDHSIAAQFEKKWYDVIYQVVPGALVIPVEGYASPVQYNETYKFEVELEEGYSQSNILVRVNGIQLNPAGGVYSLTNIFGEQIITIEGVVLNKYELVAQAYTGGTITPAGVFVVTHGESKAFNIISNAGFIVNDVVVNGESMGDVDTYTFFDIRGNSTIKAYFAVPQGIDPNDVATINVFSNHNVVTIMNENLISIKQVEIMDMYGRLVWSGQALSQRTEITLDVAAGIYGVRITTESNTVNTTKVSITK